MSRGGRAGVVIAALAATACLDAPPSSTSGVCPAPVEGDPDPLLGDVLTYTFDEDVTQTEVIHDRSGHRLDGGLAGASISVDGRYGPCVGPESGEVPLIVVPANPLLHVGGALTLETWLYRSRTATTEGLMAVYDPGSAVGELVLQIAADDAVWFGVASEPCGNASMVWAQAPPDAISLGSDRWFHLAVTWDGGRARFFVDGEAAFDAPLEASPCPMDRPLTIGSIGDNLPLIGWLDDVKISSYAKTQQQIEASLAFDPRQAARCGDLLVGPGEDCEPPAFCCDPETCRYASASCDCDGQCVAGLCVSDEGRTDVGLVALYDFDEGSGRDVHDTSGTGLDLAIQGDAFEWRTGSLVLLEGDTLLQSATAADSVVDACQASQEVTVEAWITPSTETQARQTIAMLALGDGCQAFALTQQEKRLSAAVWTALTDGEGEPYIDTPDSSIGTVVTHAVLTRSADGWRRYYLDGRLVGENLVAGDFSPWDAAMRLTIGGPVTGFSDTCENGVAGFWLGTIHRLAVYDRALSAAEVAGNYGAGLDNETAGVR